MKAQILKIAGVKSEKEFYKKYPSEEAFMKVHSKEFKKAALGAKISTAQTGKVMPYGYNPDYMAEDTYPYEGENVFNPAILAGTFPQMKGLKSNVDWKSQYPSMQNMKGMPKQLGYNLSGNATGQQFDLSGKPMAGLSAQQSLTSQGAAAAGKKGGGLGQMAGLVNLPGEIVKGVKAIKAEKDARKSAEMWEKVSNVNLDAARSTDLDTNRQLADNMTKKREAMMPVNTGEEFFPIYGVGTNPLAKNGKALKNKVGGNPTEIQNTYAPKTLYSDLGYAQGGAAIPGADLFGQATSMAYGDNAGSQLGGSLGGAVGSIFGPAGSLIGGEIGKFAGYALDQNPEKMKRARENTQKNVGMMAMNNWGKGLQQQNSGYMEDGGWLSHDWLPQVITNFGDHTMKSLMRSDPTMDTLRAGGHLQKYTPPSEEAMQTYAMGGDLQTHWGGHAEPVAYNPYMPGDNKETVRFVGNKHTESDGHGRTGIGVTYGNSPVEVQNNEPMFEMQDGGQIDPSTGKPETSAIVLGDLKFNKNLAKTLGDPILMQIAKDYGNSKYQNIGNDIAKQTANINTKMEKLTDKVINRPPSLTAFGKLEDSALQAMDIGFKMKLKNFADQNMALANFQQAHNDVAKENNYDANALAKGKVEYAKLGISLSKAQGGKRVSINQNDYDNLIRLYTEAEKQGTGSKVKEFQDAIRKLSPDLVQSIMSKFGGTNLSKKLGVTDPTDTRGFSDGIFKERTKAVRPLLDEALKNWKTDQPPIQSTYVPPTYPWVTDPNQKADQLEKITDVPASKTSTATTVAAATPKKPGFDWMTMLNNMMPYLRPSDSDTLDPRQLAGEMFALSNNQQEPVYAQTVNPQLTVPYDVSLQDILNENTAASRAVQRSVGYNPAAQANIAAQQYAANQKVLGEQFRMNQDMKNKTYAQNRQDLNQAQATNLGIFAQQADKQALAKSNTKMQTQAALQSISAKMLENQAKNKELKTYENLYNYRFGKDQIAQNWNPLAQWNMSGSGRSSGNIPGFTASYKQLPDGTYEVDAYKKDKASAKNGTLVKSFK